MRDLDQMRAFLSSPGPAALFDLPWIPLYVGICFLFHSLIGVAGRLWCAHSDCPYHAGRVFNSRTCQGCS